MRDRVFQGLAVAMIFYEGVRGVMDCRAHWKRRMTGNAEPASAASSPRETSRFREWGAVALVAGLATVPVLYYGGHVFLA